MIIGEAQIQQGLRIYAIGDVHGCIDQLKDLVERIDVDFSIFSNERCRLVFLGDYVDRGPANRDVIDCLIEMEKSDRDCVFLLGNHDDKFLGFLNRPDETVDGFLRWGGVATLRDYGVVQKPGETAQELSVRFAQEVPAAHLDFLNRLKYSHCEGDYFFCHAGVRPHVTLAEQQEHDLIWIRNDFLLHDQPFEKVVVHGHTPVEEPEVKLNRINVDTRCYDSNVLTAVVLEGNNFRFIST